MWKLRFHSSNLHNKSSRECKRIFGEFKPDESNLLSLSAKHTQKLKCHAKTARKISICSDGLCVISHQRDSLNSSIFHPSLSLEHSPRWRAHTFSNKYLFWYYSSSKRQRDMKTCLARIATSSGSGWRPFRSDRTSILSWSTPHPHFPISRSQRSLIIDHEKFLRWNLIHVRISCPAQNWHRRTSESFHLPHHAQFHLIIFRNLKWENREKQSR